MNKITLVIIGIVVVLGMSYAGFRVMRHIKRVQNASTISVVKQGGTTTGANSDTSNAQLDKDLQDVQGSMNKLNADQGQAEQVSSNQNADTPLQ